MSSAPDPALLLADLAELRHCDHRLYRRWRLFAKTLCIGHRDAALEAELDRVQPLIRRGYQLAIGAHRDRSQLTGARRHRAIGLRAIRDQLARVAHLSDVNLPDNDAVEAANAQPGAELRLKRAQVHASNALIRLDRDERRHSRIARDELRRGPLVAAYVRAARRAEAVMEELWPRGEAPVSEDGPEAVELRILAGQRLERAGFSERWDRCAAMAWQVTVYRVPVLRMLGLTVFVVGWLWRFGDWGRVFGW